MRILSKCFGDVASIKAAQFCDVVSHKEICFFNVTKLKKICFDNVKNLKEVCLVMRLILWLFNDAVLTSDFV
jgi:hypothetical protein